ncbi:MAG: hypothetical protein H6506_01730 [Calditrichaeota bacterium]|nr:hypothetical protein [Calditrichota bacterium]
MLLFLASALLCFTLSSFAVPTTLNDFFLPGSQPNQSGTFRNPNQCDNCHSGFGLDIEQDFNWRGGMMAQAMRDPLFLATMAIANQDAPDAGDLCIRCHSPVGWLSGRSTPTDGSGLTGIDFDGVQCHFCHKMVKPTPLGVNPYPGDATYTATTYGPDQTYLATLGANIPPASANGMYVVSNVDARRGPIADAGSPHGFLYSPMHKSSDICATCHDVSNPVFTKNVNGQYIPNSFDSPSPSFDLRTMFPVERTYSEWSVSDYNTTGGVFAPEFGTDDGVVRTCQDCHMRSYDGEACDQGAIRQNMGRHDLTGGNTIVSRWIKTLNPGATENVMLDSAVARARRTLALSATLELAAEVSDGNVLATVTVTNETGHKLPSGYPEGRRMWLNVKGFDASNVLLYESGAYDAGTGVLTHDAEAKIYEIKPGISPGLAGVVGYPAGPSFHFVLNDTVYSDNRIPPRGVTNAELTTIQSPVVNHVYADGQYWDETEYVLPLETDSIAVTLYYQTTSKEYIEFLRDNNFTDSWGDSIYALWDTTGKSAPEIMEQDYLRVIHPLAAVDDLTIVFVSEGGGQLDFLLYWTPISGAASYTVYSMSSPDDLTGTLIGTVSAPPYALIESNAIEDVRYYRVRAVE